MYKALARNVLNVFLFSAMILFAFGNTASAESGANKATREELLAQVVELTKIVKDLQAMVALQQGSKMVVTNPFFPGVVAYDSNNPSISLLQRILATDPAIYPEGIVTGYFGVLTEKALRNFQEKYLLQKVTGTFTEETALILTNVLQSVSFESYTKNYLLQEDVKQKLQIASVTSIPKDSVINGVVALPPNPVFSDTYKTSSLVTVQRVLATDLQLLNISKVNGLFDVFTQNALIAFRIKYGIPYKMQFGQKITPEDLLDEQTINLIKKILIINNSATVKAGLLFQKEVSPTVLIPNTTRKLLSISAIRDYKLNHTSVSVFYEGSVTESFKIKAVSPNSDVVSEVAKQINRTSAEVRSFIKHSSVNAKSVNYLLLDVETPTKMNLSIGYLDGTSEFIKIERKDILDFVEWVFPKDEEGFNKYLAEFNKYVTLVQSGKDLGPFYNLVSLNTRIPAEEVREALVVDVSKYLRKNDQDGGGGNN